MVHCGFSIAFGRAVFLRRLFNFPRVSTLVVEQAWEVVAFVEVFEDRGEDFWDLFWQVDSFGCGFDELATANGCEEGRGGEDVLVGCEEALLGTNAEGDDGGSQVAALCNPLSDDRKIEIDAYLPMGGL